MKDAEKEGRAREMKTSNHCPQSLEPSNTTHGSIRIHNVHHRRVSACRQQRGPQSDRWLGVLPGEHPVWGQDPDTVRSTGEKFPPPGAQVDIGKIEAGDPPPLSSQVWFLLLYSHLQHFNIFDSILYFLRHYYFCTGLF